jgi:hypothetical protein
LVSSEQWSEGVGHCGSVTLVRVFFQCNLSGFQ